MCYARMRSQNLVQIKRLLGDGCLKVDYLSLPLDHHGGVVGTVARDACTRKEKRGDEGVKFEERSARTARRMPPRGSGSGRKRRGMRRASTTKYTEGIRVVQVCQPIYFELTQSERTDLQSRSHGTQVVSIQ